MIATFEKFKEITQGGPFKIHADVSDNKTYVYRDPTRLCYVVSLLSSPSWRRLCSDSGYSLAPPAAEQSDPLVVELVVASLFAFALVKDVG